jgi:hypothetical protein
MFHVFQIVTVIVVSGGMAVGGSVAEGRSLIRS